MNEEISIPPNFIAQFGHSIFLDDQEFDCTLTLSVFGEVLGVDFLVFDLPKDAQRLMLGKEVDLILKKLRSETQLLKYKIPLLVANQFIDPSFDEMLNELREFKYSLGMYEYQVNLNLVQDIWLRDFYLLLSDEYKMGLLKTSKGLRAIGDLLSGDLEIFSKSCTQLKISKIDLCTPIVLVLFPRLEKKKNILAAYGLFGEVRNKVGKNFLLSELEKRNRTYSSKIINSLSYYEDKIVNKKLLKYYIEHRGHSDPELIALMKCMKQLDLELTENSFWDLLTKKSLEVSTFAFEVLKNKKVRDIVIIEKLHPTFYNFKNPKELELVLNLYKRINNYTILPDPDAFLFALIKSLNKGDHLRMAEQVGWFLVKEWSPSVNDKIFKLLEHKEKTIRRSALVLIRMLFLEYRQESIEELPDWVIEKIKELLNDYSNKVQTEALNFFGKPGRWSNDPTMIPLLLPLVADTVLLKTQVLDTINSFLAKLPFDDSILPVYLNALDDPNQRVRISALNGLKYSDSKKVLEKLISMKENESEFVKNKILGILKSKKIEVKVKAEKSNTPKTKADIYVRDMYKRMAQKKKFKEVKKEPETPKDNSVIERLTQVVKNLFEEFNNSKK